MKMLILVGILVVLSTTRVTSSVVANYSCNFDVSLCNWSQDTSVPLAWTIRKGKTPTNRTGPQRDASGSGSYLYLEASGSSYGDKAGLISPIIYGPHCMSFMYHMYGATMGSVIVYIKTSTSTRPVWIKTLSQGNQWFEARIQINETTPCQVVIQGIRGQDRYSDAAIDEVTFTEKTCQSSVTKWLHVYFSEEENNFKVDTRDNAVTEMWDYQFSFLSHQTQTHQSDTIYYIYPQSYQTHTQPPINKTSVYYYYQSCIEDPFSARFSVKRVECYPLDFFYGSNTSRHWFNQSKVLLLNRMNGTYPQGLGLEGERCCGEHVENFFYANISYRSVSSCSPGWTSVGNICIRLTTKDRVGEWSRFNCLKDGGHLVIASTDSEYKALVNYMENSPFAKNYKYFVGISRDENSYRWLWENSTILTGDILTDIKDESKKRNCAMLRRNKGTWEIAATYCYLKRNFICSKTENTSSKQCDVGWIHVNKTCFKFSALICYRLQSSLAIIDTKSMVRSLGHVFNAFLSAQDVGMYIGMRYLPELRWSNGKPIDQRFWYPGFPWPMETLNKDCAQLRLTDRGWHLIQVRCASQSRFICQRDELNHAYKMSTFHNSATAFGHHSYVVDGNYASCYQTQPSKNPWIKIRLAKKMFISQVEITNRRSCCLRNDVDLSVFLGNSSSVHCIKYLNIYARKSIVFICSQSVKTTDVTIQLVGDSRVLTLCEVRITAFESPERLHGVLQKLWFHVSSKYILRLRGDVRFPSQPDTMKIFQDFDALPHSLASIQNYYYSYFGLAYGSQMTTYLQVPISGNYTFSIACDDECELWIDENGITSKQSIDQEYNLKKIANLESHDFVDYNQWDRFPDKQSSKSIFLSHCLMYKLELLFKRYKGYGLSSVAMRFPNGTFEAPIKKDRLYWVFPGFKNLEFSIEAYKKTVFSESSKTPLTLKASYKYCCEGAYCPTCPIKVDFNALNKTVTVNKSLTMDCTRYTANIDVNIMVQPGRYPMRIQCTYNSQLLDGVQEKSVGTIVVLPKSIFQCNFTAKDTCSLQNGHDNGTNQWNFTIVNHEQYLFLDNSCRTAWLESAWIQNDQILRSVGVCLSFDFLLPTSSQSSLEVFLKTPSRPNGLLRWKLSGYQGDKWTKGQVFWNVLNTFKIVFIGKSLKEKSVGLDTIRLVTSKCLHQPKHSTPGHRCVSITDFQCSNGQCVDKDVVCDGDSDCIDGSDEANCTCLSNTFSCLNGGCLSPVQLCDGKKDCQSNGADEKNCGQQCPDNQFQCVGGGCITMSWTCDGISQCEDGTDEPDLCDISGCPLNNLSCLSSHETSFDQKCSFSKVSCDFDQSSLCSLTQDVSGNIEWRIHSGFTPTPNTGPSYDHTTLDITGKYLYMEASDRQPGEKAILTSEEIFGGQPVCVGFWYHMFGADIGALNIYYKTNNSQVLIWQRTGHLSKLWLFGQTSFNTAETFKIIFEGVTASGALGDIAIDDLTISYGSCARIDYYEKQSCYFNLDTCNWKASQGWKLTYLGKRPLQHDWQGSILGEYIYISPKSSSMQVMTSPLIRTALNIKCIRFWHYLSSSKSYGGQISVHIVAGNEKFLLWRSSTELSAWQYVQLPLTYHNDLRVTIEGKTVSTFSRILVDDVTFSVEQCSKIPRPGKRIVQSSEAVRHWRLDGKDNDLRTVGSMFYYPDSGYQVAYFDGQTGYLDSQALDFYFRSFSLVCWVNVRDSQRLNHFYSDWSVPYQFRLYAFLGKVCFELRGSKVFKVIYICSVIRAREWTMVGFTWDIPTKTARMYVNGEYDNIKVVKHSHENLKGMVTNHSKYQIGLKKDSNHKLNGLMRDLMVFYRVLNHTEMKLVYDPSGISCPVRQTKDGECCVFPFIYQGIPRYSCLQLNNGGFWCATTSNVDKDRQYGTCNVVINCNKVQDGFCGWKNTSRSAWSRGVAKDMEILKKKVDNAIDDVQWINNSERDFDIDFPEGHSSYMNLTGIPAIRSYTICFWAKTNDTRNAGTAFRYQTRSPGGFKIHIAMIDYRGLQFMTNGKLTAKTGQRYNDGLWHHICQRWNADNRMIYIKISDQTMHGYLKSVPQNDIIPGGGELIVSLPKQQADGNYGHFVGNINSFNLWTRFLSDKDIEWMSSGCLMEINQVIGRPLISWEALLTSFVGQVRKGHPSTCKDHKGPRILLNLTQSHELAGSSIHESIQFDKSPKSPKICFQFSYIIYSPVKQLLRLYQMLEFDSYQPRLVWQVKENSKSTMWKYSEVSITGLSDFKLRFESFTGISSGFIAVKQINARHGLCKSAHQPVMCNKTMTSPQGYLYSPLYPAAYSPNLICTWRIQAHPLNVIRLYFDFFELEEHPTCEKDYVTVYDNMKIVGKYCGTRYPQFVDSTGNTMIVTFSSNNNVQRSGFKARFESKPENGRTRDTCMSYRGCPIGCECSVMSGKEQGVSIVSRKGVKLTTIPTKQPSGTKALHFQYNRISRLLKNDFHENVAKYLQYLDLSHNVLIDIQRKAFFNVKVLKVLRLNANFLRSIPAQAFSRIPQLTTLDLGDNLIRKIDPTLFASLPMLTTLSLRSNKISVLNERTFASNKNLTALYLSFNNIKVIPDELLNIQRNLKILYLNDNKIMKFTSSMFKGLGSIEQLYLQNNNPREFDPEIFQKLISLKELKVDDFFLCCHANKAIPGVHCESPKDFFSSCSDLMKNRTLQVCIWILGLSALLGNFFVIILRIRDKEDNKVHSFLLTNLASADFLMGAYMLVIAIKDVQFQGEYFRHDYTWRNGIACRIAGALSLLSSEVSVLLLTLITADRFKNIVFPFRGGKLSYKGACISTLAIWIVCIIMSVLPMVNLQYFNDSTRHVGYYGRSALCLPLQLTKDKLAGWEYSVAIFIVLNLVSFVWILCAYIIMFVTVTRSARSVRSTSANKESQLAKRMAFIIGTDFCCWMPVIIIGILSLLGIFHDPEQIVYAWLAVFVIPVNSSINPILYTFSTTLYFNKIMNNSIVSTLANYLSSDLTNTAETNTPVTSNKPTELKHKMNIPSSSRLVACSTNEFNVPADTDDFNPKKTSASHFEDTRL